MWAMIDAFCRCNDTAAMCEWIALLSAPTAATGGEATPLSSGDKNQLIAYYGRCGMLDHVEAVAQSLEENGEDVSFNALNATAKAFARQGRFDKCVETLHKLRDRDMVPDAATALTLSQMFIRAGLHEQAQQIIQWRRFHARSGQPDQTEPEEVIV
jgi:pentatricopeptide repeat protein